MKLYSIEQNKKRIDSALPVGAFSALYENAPEAQNEYSALLSRFKSEFGPAECAFASAPGRTELCGNHTDHQRGRVLAAAVKLDIRAVFAPRGDMRAVVLSDGASVDIDLRSLAPVPSEEGRSAALVRGVAAALCDMGARAGGFSAVLSSSVPRGAGLSSSAAYEVLVGVVLNALYNENRFAPVQLAMAGQRAENEYFNKPCGLMDQLASAVGGVAAIDFLEPGRPIVEKIACDFSRFGYTLAVVNAGGSHARLTGEYAAIRREMRAVAGLLGAEELRGADEKAFRERLPGLRKLAGDRAVLRAMHFFDENERARQAALALKNGDIEAYKRIMLASGASSMGRLQNIWPSDGGAERSIALALALTEDMLSGSGAWRVHGGGFAGTVQALVPRDMLPAYSALMDSAFGPGACSPLHIRPAGGCVVE